VVGAAGRRWHAASLSRRLHSHRRTARSDGQFGQLGLRVVDARTGGPVTLSSAIRAEAFDAGLRWLVRALVGPTMERAQTRRQGQLFAGVMVVRA
jgi:hypothetical protein